MVLGWPGCSSTDAFKKHSRTRARARAAAAIRNKRSRIYHSSASIDQNQQAKNCIALLFIKGLARSSERRRRRRRPQAYELAHRARPQTNEDTPQHQRSSRMPARARYTCFPAKRDHIASFRAASVEQTQAAAGERRRDEKREEKRRNEHIDYTPPRDRKLILLYYMERFGPPPASEERRRA